MQNFSRSPFIWSLGQPIFKGASFCQDVICFNQPYRFYATHTRTLTRYKAKRRSKLHKVIHTGKL